MRPETVTLILGLATMTVLTPKALPAEPPAPIASLHMSPDLQRLFQAEMKELLLGTQKIAASLPIANWDGVASSARAMRASYVLEKELTTAQRRDLEKLPEKFKALDEAFHLRAEKLARAAEVQDAEAVSFQFSRLLDTCVACHSIYARSRFPNFRSEVEAGHHH